MGQMSNKSIIASPLKWIMVFFRGLSSLLSVAIRNWRPHRRHFVR